jgi:DNA invertase Pin-like site-specific DNA recombinase
MNQEEIVRSTGASKGRPTDNGSKSLPGKKAFIYTRLSSKEQAGERKASIREIAKLVVLAKKDGYKTGLDPDRVEKWLESIESGEQVNQVIEDGDVVVDYRDIGLSGSLGKDRRPGLGHLWQCVESGEIGTVYTPGMTRLTRDGVLGDKLLRLFKESRCRLRMQE